MVIMASPWEEAKELVSTIVRETTADNHHPPSFHWLGNHTHLSWGLKELEWMPHINLVQELVQLTDIIATANPNTQELMSCLSSQLELFYTNSHAELQSLLYYCNTTLRRHMNDQLMLTLDKNYERLVLAVIGCIRATESLQMAFGSLPEVLQVAYTQDIPQPTLFSIDEKLLEDDIDNDELDTNYSSDDTDAEKCEFLNDRSASFEGNSINSSISLQEARSGFLRLVMGEDPTEGPTESTANVDRIHPPSGSISTEEFIWSLGEQEEDKEKNSKPQELNMLTSSAVTSLLATTPNSKQGSNTNLMSEGEVELGQGKIQQHQPPQQQQQQQKHHKAQYQLPLDISRTIAQHPLLPHRFHTFLENPVPTINIKRPWESPKIGTINSKRVIRRSPNCTKNTANSPTLKDQQFSLNTLLTGTSSDNSIQKVNGKGKRTRNNSYEEFKDGPMRSVKRSRTSLEANASKMQQRFISMVDQIVSSKFTDPLANISSNEIKMNSRKNISEAISGMWVDTAAKVNITENQHDTKALSIAEVKINTTESSPKNTDEYLLLSDSTGPKLGFYREIDSDYSTLEKDVNPIFVEKKDNLFSEDKNNTTDFSKTPERLTAQTPTKKEVKKPRGRPRLSKKDRKINSKNSKEKK